MTNVVDEKELDLIRKRLLDQQKQETADENDVIAPLPLNLSFQFKLERAARKPNRIDWNKFKSRQNIPIEKLCWYHLCESMERYYLASYYKREKPGKLDIGGFVGVMDIKNGDVLCDFPECADSEQDRFEWYRQHILSPWTLMNSLSNENIIIIRVTREFRRLLYNHLYGETWLYNFFNKYAPRSAAVAAVPDPTEQNAKTEEEREMMDLIRGLEEEQSNEDVVRLSRLEMQNCIKECYILIGSWPRRLNMVEDLIPLRLKNTQGEPFMVKCVLKKFKHGAYQRQFDFLSKFIHLLNQEQLSQLTVYDVNETERIFVPDIELMLGYSLRRN